jgi:hypothetical protein
VGNSRLTHAAHFGLTPEQARDVRARAWAFVFACLERKKATRPGAPDARKESNGSGKVSIPN